MKCEHCKTSYNINNIFNCRYANPISAFNYEQLIFKSSKDNEWSATVITIFERSASSRRPLCSTQGFGQFDEDTTGLCRNTIQ
jgi:hypothetical protein